MQWLAELCVRRPVFASVLSIVILVVGGVFYRQLGVDQFPKIDFPAIVVVTTQPGASPEDIEREITDKIEGAVNTISGIDELRSNSSEGVSQVVVQFVLEKNVDVASQEVQQKINLVLAELPKGIDRRAETADQRAGGSGEAPLARPLRHRSGRGDQRAEHHAAGRPRGRQPRLP